MEENTIPSPQENQESAIFGSENVLSRHSGIPSLEEFNRLKDIKNREVQTFLTPYCVMERMYELPQHPYKRPLIGIHTDSFKTAIRIITEEILDAKRWKRGVFHMQCCNYFWIGTKPRVHNHVMNDLIRKMIDPRNVPKSLYNPDYLPPEAYIFDLTDEPAEPQPTVVPSTEELIKQDEFWSKMFGANYHKKVSEDEVLNHLRKNDPSRTPRETTEVPPVQPDSATSEGVATKRLIVESRRLNQELNFFNEGAEIGKERIKVIRIDGEERYLTDDEDSTEEFNDLLALPIEEEGNLG